MVNKKKEFHYRNSRNTAKSKKSSIINLIGLTILTIGLITATIIIVNYFSVTVEVENKTTETITHHEEQNSNSSNSDTPGKVAPSEEVVPETIPSEELVENKSSEEEEGASNPSEEGETEISVLRIKVQIDHIGKVWTRWINISQAEGTTIGHDEIVQIVLTNMSREFGNVSYVNSIGDKADHTFGKTEAIYNTIIWIIG